MYEIEIDRLHDILDATPVAMNIMIVSDSGIGKTTQVERYCKERGIYLKTLILSQLEASETLGIPVQSEREWNGKKYHCLDTAIPSWVFDLAEHQDGAYVKGRQQYGGAMLFLDEFLCAQPSVMNAFLNFLTQKNVHGVDLRNVRVVAATNIGNYTFDPDTNMLARFCWFYAVNSTMNQYLDDKRIINNYTDKNEREGVIFEPRELKPRCQEWLMDVDDEHLQIFYEGFTNTRYVRVHKDPEINSVISAYFEPVNTRLFGISDESIVAMVAVMTRTFTRFRKWDKILDGFMNLDMETREKINNEVRRVTGGEQ